MIDRFTNGWDGGRHKGLRIGTLWMSNDVDGDVTMSPAFDALDLIAQLDVLGDCIALLKREYVETFRNLYGDPPS